MDLLNGLLTHAFDLLMSPFAELNPWIGMCVATVVITVVLLLAFKLTSRPAAIREAKGRLIARTLELVLYQHDMAVSLTGVGRILWANTLYLKELLIPLAVAIVFALPLLAQCAAWFESRPLRIGEPAMLEVVMNGVAESGHGRTDLSVPAVVRADTQPLVVQSNQSDKSPEVNWRLSGAEKGQGMLEITVEGSPVRKSVVVGTGLARVSRKLPPAGDYWERLLYPSEPAASGAIKSAELHYPFRNWYVDLPIIGFWDVNWLVALFVLSIVFGIILKKPLRVTL